MDTEAPAVLDKASIRLGLGTVDRDEAIRAAGQMLVERGLVTPDYIAAMLKREESVSTYMGNGVSLPHGTFEAKSTILGTGIVVHQYPSGVEWPNGTAYLVIGLAAKNEEHVAVLSKLADVLQDEDLCEQLWTTSDPDFMYTTLTATSED